MVNSMLMAVLQILSQRKTRGMLPFIHTFVVGESHRMKLKDGITRATSEASYTL